MSQFRVRRAVAVLIFACAELHAQGISGPAQDAQQRAPQQLLPASELTILSTLQELQSRVTRQPCRPAPPVARRAASGGVDTVRIISETGFPCTIVAAPTGVELRSSADGSRPDPQWTSVVRDGRGRFFTAARRAPVVLSYNANGTFNAVVGRGGSGPGELRSTPVLYSARGDTLYAFQGGRAAVFAPDMMFVREVPLPGFQPRRESLHISDDGRMIISAGSPGRGAVSPSRAYVIGRDGTVERGVSPLQSAAGARAGTRPPEHSVAYGGGPTFWIARASAQRDGYVLEEWALSGELRRVVLRSATWARSDASDESFVPGGFPFVRGLSVDPDGYLWALMLVKDPAAGSLAGARITDENESRFFDVRYEAVDPESGTVLVSGVMSELPGENEPLLPPLPFFLPRTHLTYKSAIDTATGLERIQVFELRAVRKQ
jgi:hypothetical protein